MNMVYVNNKEGNPFDFDKLISGCNNSSASNCCYIIDVHCTFLFKGRYLRLLDQGGVVFYRHLLKRQIHSQNQMKVIFHSPFNQDQLVYLSKGENYILKLLPFIECNFEGEEQFKREINALVEKYNKVGWPQFNNASENLLSGWALCNKESGVKNPNDYVKISLPENSKLLIIDDQYREWESTYKILFYKYSDAILMPKYKTQLETRLAWDNGDAINEVLKKAEEASFVLSELYVIENHQQTKPFKDEIEVKDISGYKIFNEIKKLHPYLPYMMFTSSNKVWNYEVFSSNGLWSWAVKETSSDVSAQDKIAQYTHFSSCIDKLTHKEWQLAQVVWKKLLKLKSSNNSTKWWYQSDSVILESIHNCLLSLDSIYSRRNTFETNYTADTIARQSANIISILGGICEELKIHFNGDKNKKNYIGIYIYLLRSFYAHGLFYNSAKPIEVIFVIDLLLFLLEKNDLSSINNTALVKENEHQKYTNLNYHLQFQALVKEKMLYSNTNIQDVLVASFEGIKQDIISLKYKNTVANQKKVIDIVNSFIKSN